MSDINNLTIIGRLTKDPTLKDVGSSKLCNFSIANNAGYGDKEYTNFFNCNAWGKTGEAIVKYLKKGQRIAIEGRIRQGRWEDDNGAKRSNVEIVVETFQFMDNKATDKIDETAMSGGNPFER